MATLNSPLHLPCFMDLVQSHKQTALTDDILETSVVDQLNDSDELMNLLSTEENCTAILQNISTNEQFQRLMNEESEFVPTEEIEQLINKTCEAPGLLMNISDPAVVEDDDESPTRKTFKCDLCASVTSTKKLLKKHMLIHTKNREFPCEVCGKLFRHKYEVTAHARTHNEPTYQCEMCSRMFIHKSHLNVHRKKHLGDYVAYCESCQTGFISAADFKVHKTIVHDKVRLICDHCGAKLSTLSALTKHKLTHDPGYGSQRSHVCEVCGKSYLNSRNLKSHKKIHSNIKSFVCSVCGKAVSSKNSLETHLKMHTGVKDFHCDICSKDFASKEYLILHQRTHNGDKPFECMICGKRFTQKTSLTVHVRFHTGQRPYKCECGKQFATKSHLMSHYKTHDIGGVDIEYITNLSEIK